MPRLSLIRIIGILAVGVGISPCVAGGAILNSSFETVSDWTFQEFDSAGYLSGNYSSEWSSDGTNCVVFYRAAGSTTAGNYVRLRGVRLRGHVF